MSMPQIPTIVAGTININRQDVINLLLASIAMEELSLAHIVNAEAEKIQAVLGTLPGGPSSVLATTFGDLLTIDRSVSSVLHGVIKKDMLLQFKLEEIISILPPPTPPTPCLNPLIQFTIVPDEINCCGVVSGRVTCEGQPVNGAIVTLIQDGVAVQNTTTDANGHFSFMITVPQGTPLHSVTLVAQTTVSGNTTQTLPVQTTLSCV